MAGGRNERLLFGPSKYAAFGLLVSRWLRHHCTASEYSYVTLGGTELRDVESLHFVDPRLIARATSFEVDRKKHVLAEQKAEQLRRLGLQVETLHRDIFDYDRGSDDPHIYFFDFTGICAWADYENRFAELFRHDVVREGDAVFVTSHIGHNPGWDRVFDTFGGEFHILGAADKQTRRLLYRRAHPSFTLFRALRNAGLTGELSMKSFGCIEYRDRSPMALYGYVIAEGRTALATFVKDPSAPYFRVGQGYLSAGVGTEA